MTASLDRRAFLELGSRVVGAASLLSFASCTRRFPLPAAIPKFLDVRIPELLAASKVPGASMAIVKDAALAWTGSYGKADADTGAPVSDTTIFEAGSVSKTVFAYAALKLCDRGILALDAPLTKYFDQRPLDDSRLDQVTVRRVLSHSIGWPNRRSASEPFEFAFTPGERWSYSGEGYWYLQSVITHLLGRVDPANCSTFQLDLRVCGTDIGDYLKKNVLSPDSKPSSWRRRCVSPGGSSF